MSQQQQSGDYIHANVSYSDISGQVAIGKKIQQEQTSLSTGEKQNLDEAAKEIQKLLEQLDNSYPNNTYFEKVRVAEEAIKRIESNPKLHQRVLSALKAGGTQAFEQFLNHPAASFVIGALEDWQKSKGS